MLTVVCLLVACTGKQHVAPDLVASDYESAPVKVPGLHANHKSRWIPVAWSELPAFEDDALFEAWNAWLKSCERPQPDFLQLCKEVRQHSISSSEVQRNWLQSRFQVYRIESKENNSVGLLTGYYEPLINAVRDATPRYNVPLYRMPPGMLAGKAWYTRQQIETLPQAQAQLQSNVIAYVEDPVDAMILHIQGSGRLNVSEADGSKNWIRLAFAGTNNQPYKSIGTWLLQQQETRDATWPGIRAWIAKNPHRTQELLWKNPRYVFFRDEPLTEMGAQMGPRGAQGVALTPGRSIAIDPQSIPYGTPIWLASSGDGIVLSRLVFAQDTGSAIVGAVRADYFVGWGAEAGELAGRLKQNLQMWALWPKSK